MRASVVIATWNRHGHLRRLLAQLARQQVPPATFEVCVVDDGSTPPVDPLGDFEQGGCPFELRVIRQENRGAAAARHRGAQEARGDVLVFLDDDMQVEPDFVARHLEAHGAQRWVVLGRIRADPEIHQMPLFERWHQHLLDRLAAEFESGRRRPGGQHLFSGNVSMPRDAYFDAGGFDPSLGQSEDVELGVRLERLGLPFRFAPHARTLHGSDHTSLEKWRGRARRYGRFDYRIAQRHPEVATVAPWRFLFELHPLARPLLAVALTAPRAAGPLASVVLQGAEVADRFRQPELAYAGTTVAYMIEYFRGVRDEVHSLSSALRQTWRFRRRAIQAR